ncbi:nitroreductase family deazaflavin-dependent oxidoreductase [Sporichthya polymorpha]|uniref:nitroreductase family deazaflavin-dependent oxidoreductase n=1 Tax=Sporichthya polymorpha TaxID=35751 RepID=UPI0003A1C445|nr:nitroreductase family deazaflavin-dependent oxidoreductase [Sporichthya polymorpha]
MAGVKKGRWGRFTTAMPTPRPDGPLFVLTKIATKIHVAIFRRTKGRVMGNFDGAPLLVLHHRGAKTGRPRATPVIYLEDGKDLVVVASMGGQDVNPAWYHNLRAHPEIEVDIRGRRRAVRARPATAEEMTALWPRLSRMWPAFEDYKKRTDREFPVFLLEPR